jgi:hypothetical protein
MTNALRPSEHFARSDRLLQPPRIHHERERNHLREQDPPVGPGCPAIALDEGMYPVHFPQGISGDLRRMVNNCPVFVNERKEPIHQIGNIIKCGGICLPT